MKTDVMVIGELLADIISTDYVTDLSEAKHFSLVQGGSPANVCATLHWLGISTTLVSCVGDDGIGRQLIQAINDIGVPIDNISKSKKYPTSLIILNRSKGTPQFIAYRSADRRIPLIKNELIEDVKIIHTGAFALSKKPARSNILDALEKGYKTGKDISIDWNYAPGIWRGNGIKVFNQVLKLNPLLKMSLDDVQRFIKRNVSVKEALTYLSDLPASVVCLTCGPDGVYFKSTERDWQFKPSIRVDNVIDVTGAGDAFWSGFLTGWIRKQSLDDCVGQGLNVAADKIQKLGPLYVRRT